MRSLRWVAWGAVALVIVAGVTTFAMWPRDDVPRDPDAVVVLGGAGPERARLGIELRDRYDATLVLSSSAVVLGYDQGLTCPPEICISPDPATTSGEARSMAVLAEQRGWEHVTVATARFHTTRARVLFRQCLGDDVTVVGTLPADGHDRGIRSYLGEALGVAAALTFDRAC
jgi:uncharacterized SAM-binding protein YcdF (DUF218 family)